jgi:hypothetical protein
LVNPSSSFSESVAGWWLSWFDHLYSRLHIGLVSYIYS